jgi:hypothetical protein
MNLPELPPPLDVSPETKKVLIDGIKASLALFQKKGLFAAEVTYTDLIHDPEILYGFIQAFKQNREAADGLVVDKAKQPVRDDETILICGVTLSQVQRLLINTCGKYHIGGGEGGKTEVKETVVRKMFFFKTVEKKQVAKTAPDERKAREMSRYLAFDWQLPLCDTYRDMLTLQMIMELDKYFLALNTPEAIQEIAKFQPQDIRKAREVTGDDFLELMLSYPGAISGVNTWNADMYKFFRKTLEDKSWQFFAREKSFFNIVSELDKATIKILGDVLLTVAPENLIEISRLNIDKTKALVGGLRAALGDGMAEVMSEPSFAKDILRRLVESFVHMKQDPDQIAVYAELTCKALVPSIVEWLTKKRSEVV